MSIIALIPAAGVGARFGANQAKQYHSIAGQSVFYHALSRISACDAIDLIVPILAPDDVLFAQERLPESCFLLNQMPKNGEKHAVGLLPLYVGGACRAQTVKNGLDFLLSHGIVGENDWVLVHDAARCCLPLSALRRLIERAMDAPSGAILALPVADTLKKAENQVINHTVSREHLWQAQTPQMFPVDLLHRALCQGDLNAMTDEASAVEQLGLQPVLVQGDSRNIKLTYPEDEHWVAQILGETMNLRIGQGYDVHQLVDNRPLILGGVSIPFNKGLLGHSDADALLHALTDALLGAAGLGDIGRHFPDTAVEFKNANSRDLLRQAYQNVQEKGWLVVNVDCTIIAQAPKLLPHIAQMCRNIAEDLHISANLVNIKGKTNEKLGYLGREEAIEAQAVVLLQAQSNTLA